jgi:hypothetical protein
LANAKDREADAIEEEPRMPSLPLESLLNADFLERVAAGLDALGFVSDEHNLVAGNETLVLYCKEIESALRDAGRDYTLWTGFTMPDPAGYAYYIYDSERFADADRAKQAVCRWLGTRTERDI